MESLYRYIIIATISVTILFIVYLLLLKKENNFKVIRVYLVSSLIFSLILPFNQAGIELPNIFADGQKRLTETNKLKLRDNAIAELSPFPTNNIDFETSNKRVKNSIDLKQVAIAIYLIISAIFLSRILFSILQIIRYYLISEKKKHPGFTIIYITKRSVPFSFFRLIFISKSATNENSNQIIEHEKIHATQFHTIDLLLTELLVAAMWFNPFIWMYKKALQQVHEFLADEGVLNSGVDQLEYQSLLVNQAAEGRLVAVSSNFSYSLIKKRIMMMSQRKTHGLLGRKILVLIPVLLVLTIGVSCVNGQEKVNNELVAAVSPTRMNVLYIGIDNPVSIAVTGADMNEIEASIDNGSIAGKNGDYTVRVKKKGFANILVKAGNKTVTKKQFRVKTLPDPIAVINGVFNKNEITKEELINANGISVLLINFDFDMKFEVVSYTVSAINNGTVKEAHQSSGGVFSKTQIDLIKNATSGSKIYFEEIKAKGPDRAVRNLSPIIINLK